MREPVAVVRSVHEQDVRAINALEKRIVQAEDDADAKLWEQAEKVAALLDARMSQRKLAAQWINARTGKVYTHRHVQIVAEAWRGYFNSQPRPRFRDIYNQITNASSDTPHVSHNSGENEWYTPREYIEAARSVLGDIDLDPASCAEANEVVQAAQFFCLADNGLAQPWQGRVWMNPPYTQPHMANFCRKLARHVEAGDIHSAVVLINNATETEWFGDILRVSRAVCFPKGRLRFWKPGNPETLTPLQGQAVLYVGEDVNGFCARFAEFGTLALVVNAHA